MRTWVDKLIIEYSDSKKQLEAYRLSLDQSDPSACEEIGIVGGMISSLQYGMQWMSTGRRPESYRGVESNDAYQHAALMDMDLFPSLNLHTEESDITMEQKRKLVAILLRMSVRERQCYLLHVAQGLSIADIGRELKISKGTAQKFFERARDKVQQGL